MEEVFEWNIVLSAYIYITIRIAKIAEIGLIVLKY